MTTIQACLESYNANFKQVVPLGSEDSAAQLPYATITYAQRKLNGTGSSAENPIGLVNSVYEWQNAPLMYLVDGSTSISDVKLTKLRNMLAMRGDAPFLGVATRNKLNVFHITLDDKEISATGIDPKVYKNDNQSLFSQLGQHLNVGNFRTNWISDIIYKLMLDSIADLEKTQDVDLNESISLVGRALFTRFLADRDLLPEERQMKSNASYLFDNQKIAETTSKWLDYRFNGDFLPLPSGVFSRLSGESYQILGNILRKAPDSQLFLGWEQKWDNLDFSHIPVGILSQVYEALLKGIYPDIQRAQSAYYTPYQLVNLMVKASIEGLDSEIRKGIVRVLDPAAGAGVFLITAFRELVAERWKIDGQRPNTKTLRFILNNQITGFEIDESALRFAALGLYLISIELDPDPGSSKSMKFNNLQGNVLYHLKVKGTKQGANLGSLDPEFGREHSGKFDIVIGNPPWSNKFKEHEWNRIVNNSKSIAAKRGIRTGKFKIPYWSLDLAFVWRAMEWAKRNGQIAMVLHARLLFHQASGMSAARMSVFDSLSVKSILNCTNLRNTNYWPNIKAPFCLLFAQNQVSAPGAMFKFLSPTVSKSLNDSGKFQINPAEAEAISVENVRGTPHILKLFSSGTREDVSIQDRMQCNTTLTLKALWNELFDGKGSGAGYSPKSRNDKIDANFSENSDEEGIGEILISNFDFPLISRTMLGRFSEENVKTWGKPESFKGPLLAVSCTPSKKSLRLKASVSDNDVMYNKYAYGYSTYGYDEGNLLARFLCLVLRSKFSLWQILLTSGKYGVERSIFEKFELDNLIIPDYRKLDTSQKNEIADLFDGLCSGEINHEAIDDWVTQLYGLSERDLSVVKETLRNNAPYKNYIDAGERKPTSSDMAAFELELKNVLTTVAEYKNVAVEIKKVDSCSNEFWKCLNISFSKGRKMSSYSENDKMKFWQIANSTSSNEFLIAYGDSGVLVGRAAQNRVWNSTHARLLAKKVVWSDLEILKSKVQLSHE